MKDVLLRLFEVTMTARPGQSVIYPRELLDLVGRRLDSVVSMEPATGQELITLRDVPGGVGNLGFSRGGHRLRGIAWADGKYVVKTWDATPRVTD